MVAQLEALRESDANGAGDTDLVLRQLRARSWAVRRLWAASDLTPAIDLGDRTLNDAERTLGPDHPSTLTSRNNLASAYESAGRLKAAIPLSAQTPDRPAAGPRPGPPDHWIVRNKPDRLPGDRNQLADVGPRGNATAPQPIGAQRVDLVT